MEHCEDCKGWNCSNCNARPRFAAGGVVDPNMVDPLVGPHDIYVPSVWADDLPDLKVEFLGGRFNNTEDFPDEG